MVRELSKKDVCSQNILKCIYRYGKISRPALSRELGISLPTVIGRVNDLVNHDILISNGTIESSLGRKGIDALQLEKEKLMEKVGTQSKSFYRKKEYDE